MTVAEFVKVMQKFRDIANRVYPEHWNFICKLRDIDTNEAQELYSVYKQAMNGRLPYNRKEQKVNDELLATVFALANDAYDYYETGPAQRFPNINLIGFGEYGKFVKVFWRNESGALCSEEGNIMNSNIYQKVAYLLHKGLEIVAIVPAVDSINPSNEYVGDDKPTKNGYLNVYHGDVFCAWDNPERFWLHPEDNGLYLAVQEQGYKKLLYTHGKGWLRKNKPDIDEDVEITFEEGLWSHFKFNMHHTYTRIGNVHTGVEFLMDRVKPKTEEEK